MKVAPDGEPLGGRAVWHHRGDAVLSIGVWTERKLGRGEDAEPLLVHHVPTGEGIVGVFDGSGGSGASIAYESRDGESRSGAWVAARVVRAGVESWFYDGVHERATFESESLRTQLYELLTTLRPRSRSKVVGTIRRDLPTTMAALCYRHDLEQVACRALWVGDSRAYALTPRGGLRVLTRDHTVETDALEQLLQDPPLTNVLCADHDFLIDSHSVLLDAPCVLVCATDGFFGYVDTPAHFECHLLGALGVADNESSWARSLAELVSSYSADDASLVVVALGYSSFEELQMSFSNRRQEVLERYMWSRPPNQGARELVRQWRMRTWDGYQPGYEQWMPPLRERDA